MYDSKSDMWSLGALLYTIISGHQPFKLVGDYGVFYQQVKKGRYHFEHPEFKQCSKEVVNLIRSLLDPDHARRLSAKEALDHQWFKIASNLDEETGKIDRDVLMRLKDYKGKTRLQKATMQMIVNQAHHCELLELEKQF